MFASDSLEGIYLFFLFCFCFLCLLMHDVQSSAYVSKQFMWIWILTEKVSKSGTIDAFIAKLLILCEQKFSPNCI